MYGGGPGSYADRWERKGREEEGILTGAESNMCFMGNRPCMTDVTFVLAQEGLLTFMSIRICEN